MVSSGKSYFTLKDVIEDIKIVESMNKEQGLNDNVNEVSESSTVISNDVEIPDTLTDEEKINKLRRLIKNARKT